MVKGLQAESFVVKVRIEHDQRFGSVRLRNFESCERGQCRKLESRDAGFEATHYTVLRVEDRIKRMRFRLQRQYTDKLVNKPCHKNVQFSNIGCASTDVFELKVFSLLLQSEAF